MADAPRSDTSSEGGSFGASYMEEYFEDVDSDEEEEEEEEEVRGRSVSFRARAKRGWVAGRPTLARG